MTFNRIFALASAALLLTSAPAYAAPPNSSITGKDASGSNVTLGAVSDGTLKSPAHSLVDATGAVVNPASSDLQTSANTKLDTLHTDNASQATAALQTTGNTSLATLATASASQATAALQTTGNTSLATIATNSGTQATAANQTSANTKLDTLHTDNTSLLAAVNGAIPAGTAIIGKVGIDQTTDGTTNAVHLVAGTALAGKFGIDQTTPGTTNAVQLITGTSGGTTAYGLQTAATTNSTSVKASSGVLYGMNLINTTTTIYYLRMYDSASAPTCSSATGFVRTWPVPPAAAAGGGGGIAVSLPSTGTQFASGIGFCVTGGPTSTDNTSAATGVFINLDYK